MRAIADGTSSPSGGKGGESAHGSGLADPISSRHRDRVAAAARGRNDRLSPHRTRWRGPSRPTPAHRRGRADPDRGRVMTPREGCRPRGRKSAYDVSPAHQQAFEKRCSSARRRATRLRMALAELRRRSPARCWCECRCERRTASRPRCSRHRCAATTRARMPEFAGGRREPAEQFAARELDVHLGV